jgi:hypothetical protein
VFFYVIKKIKIIFASRTKNNCATYINIRDFSDGLPTKAGQGQNAGVLHRLLTIEKVIKRYKQKSRTREKCGTFCF